MADEGVTDEPARRAPVQPSPWRQRLQAEWLLLIFAALAIALAILDPQSWQAYQHWLQLPTLAGLLGLLIAIQGLADSGVLQRVAADLATRMQTVRGLGLLLVAASALLSMVLTNDISLFLLVPLTVAIRGVVKLPLLRLVVLEALAVNAGSTLSPIGNPQNLLLWQVAQVSFLDFVAAMLPAAVVMWLLLAMLTWWWLPSDRIALQRDSLEPRPMSGWMALLSCFALVTMVLLIDHGRSTIGTLVLLASFALLSWRTLTRIDWLLLATFAAIFVAVGHFSELACVQHALNRLDFTQPLTLYASGIIASQLISNVPATVLLLDRASDPLALAVAVNVGGFGLAIGSLANLIALRLARQPGGLRLLHRVSVPLLLLCTPLVYAVWRWLG